MNKHGKALLASLFVAAILTAAAFADEALTWSRIGKGGLDGPYNYLQYGLNAPCVFKGALYVGTGGGMSFGGQIWRYDGHEWVMVHKPKPGHTRIDAVTTLAVLGDYLYGGMSVNDGTCEVWRTDGTGKPPYRWTKISAPANISQQYTYMVSSMTVVNGYLYCGTWNNVKACQVWKYSGSAWTQVVGQGPSGSPTGPGFGNKNNYVARSMTSSASGDLYVGTGNSGGGEVWRLTSSGWTKLNKPGFGASKNSYISVLIFFKNSLYAGTQNYTKGAQVWKYLGPGPANWKAIGLNGMGDANNYNIGAAAVFGNPGWLYIITANYENGCQVLRTNGTKWEKANANGFGEGKTNGDGGALAVFDGKLYAGLNGDFGSRVYATAGGAKVPFAWTLTNDSGFSLNDNERIGCSAFFGGKLYVGTYNGLGCEIWRYEGNAWTQVVSGGFGDPNNYEAESMAVADGYLYVGTGNWLTGAEVWRYDGSKWTQANKDGFGDATSGEAAAMIVHQDKLYVGTQSYNTKAKVWRCDGLKTTQWTKVNTNGFGMATTVGAISFAVLNNKLYAGTYDMNDPCHAWRYDGPGPSNWTLVSAEGFGNKANHGVDALAVYKDALYASVYSADQTGCQIWRYSGNGTSWSRVNVSGFGKANNGMADAMIVFKNLLYVGTWNGVNGGEIWSYDGGVWSQANKSGFGTNNNYGVLTLAGDGADLYAGTVNDMTGGEVWTTGAGSDSPLILRANPFPSFPKAHRKYPKEAYQSRFHSRTR